MPPDKIELNCAKCGTRLKFSTKFVGRMGMCIACGEQFLIKPEKPPEEPKQSKKPSTKSPGKTSSKFNFKISTYFKKPPKQ